MMKTLRTTHIATGLLALVITACGTDQREIPGDGGTSHSAGDVASIVLEDKTPSQFGGSVDLPGNLPESVAPNPSEFAEGLSTLVGERMELTETNDRYLLTSQGYTGFITKKVNHFSIERNEVNEALEGVQLQRIEKAEEAGVRHPNEDAMTQSALRLTGLLGASDSEMSDAVYRQVGAASQVGDSHVVAQKIFVFRRVAGLEVPSDRSVVTYDLEGRFKAMRGTWTPYENGGDPIDLGSAATREEFAELARQKAYRQYPSWPETGESPQASVIFELKESPEGYVALVEGLVAVPLLGPNHEIRHTFLPFELSN